MANIEAISKTNEATVLQGQVGVEAAEATLEFIGSMKNQNFGRSLLKMMTDTIKPLNTTFQSFQKIGLGGFGSKMMAFTQSLKGMDPEAARQAIKTFEEQNRAEIEHAKQQANFYSQIPELASEANSALTTFNELQQTARQTKRLSAEDLEKLKKTNEARASLNSEWERLMSQLQKAFYPTPGMINMLVTGLKVLNGAIEGVIWFFDKLGGILGAIIHPLDALSGKAEKIDLLPWIGFGVIGLAAYKTMVALFTKFKSLASIINVGPLVEAISTGASTLKSSLVRVGTGIVEFSKSAIDFIVRSLMRIGSTIWDATKASYNYLKQAFMRIGSTIWDAGKASVEFISRGASRIWAAISEFGTTLSKIPGKIATYIGRIPGSIMNYIKGLLPRFGGGLTNIFSSIGRVVAGIFPKIIGFVTKMFGIIGWLYTAWEAGQAIGTQIYKMISNFQWFADLTDKVAAAFDKTVNYVSDIFTSIAESIGNAFKWIKEKFSSLFGGSDKKPDNTSKRSASGKVIDNTGTSQPSAQNPSANVTPNTSDINSPSAQGVAPVKPPTQSTINSPSMVSAAPSTEATSNGGPTPDQRATTKDKPTGDSAINTSLDYQNTLLEQLLLTMNSSVSTSKDILKYTRAST